MRLSYSPPNTPPLCPPCAPHSGVHGPAHLDARIEAFLESFGDRLSGMAEEEFEKHRAALLSTKLMKVLR